MVCIIMMFFRSIIQGLVAGVNSALKCFKREEFILNRRESYIGVLVDDLTSQGVSEPYRMFTRYIIGFVWISYSASVTVPRTKGVETTLIGENIRHIESYSHMTV